MCGGISTWDWFKWFAFRAYVPIHEFHFQMLMIQKTNGKKEKKYNETDYEHTFSHRAITVIYGIRSFSRKNHAVMDDELTNSRTNKIAVINWK